MTVLPENQTNLTNWKVTSTDAKKAFFIQKEIIIISSFSNGSTTTVQSEKAVKQERSRFQFFNNNLKKNHLLRKISFTVVRNKISNQISILELNDHVLTMFSQNLLNYIVLLNWLNFFRIYRFS